MFEEEVGKLRVQLVWLPTFGAKGFWEVREGGKGEWKLYRSDVVLGHPELVVQGYVEVTFAGEALRGYFRRLQELVVPVAVDCSGQSGRDGEETELALCGDLSSVVRFRWWSEFPRGWGPLVRIAEEMRGAFEAAGR
jgi:hypothetical protein